MFLRATILPRKSEISIYRYVSISFRNSQILISQILWSTFWWLTLIFISDQVWIVFQARRLIFCYLQLILVGLNSWRFFQSPNTQPRNVHNHISMFLFYIAIVDLGVNLSTSCQIFPLTFLLGLLNSDQGIKVNSTLFTATWRNDKLKCSLRLQWLCDFMTWR